MNKHLEKVSITPVRKYRELLKDGLDLTLGEGHFNSSFQAKVKGYEALLNNDTKYCEVIGLEALRKEFIRQYYPQYDAYNEIIITNGSTQGLFAVLFSLINDDDEVIILSPHYSVYEHLIRSLGGKVVCIDTKNTGFKVTTELLSACIHPKTKAIIFNEPCNPTGITYSEEEKRELIGFLKQQSLYVIVDELYRHYTEKTYLSFSTFIDSSLKSRFIFINGLSKSHLMTGYRIGFVVCDRKLREELKKVNYMQVGCVATIMQHSALGAHEDEAYSEFVRKYYINNRIMIKEELESLGFEVVDATGGYYLFVNIKHLKTSADDFCAELLNRFNIAVVPGHLFGEGYEDYIRISCCKDVENLTYFVNSLQKYLD